MNKSSCGQDSCLVVLTTKLKEKLSSKDIIGHAEFNWTPILACIP